MACIIAETFIARNHRAFRRARKSLYHFPADPSAAGLFLFAGWLRLEERARRNLASALRRRSSPNSLWDARADGR